MGKKRKEAWTLMIDNIAQMWALYCLVIFYQALKYELAPLQPLPKFLCVKAVVFFSFWQGLFLEMLVLTGAIKGRWGGLLSVNFENLTIKSCHSVLAVSANKSQHQ